MDPIIADLIVIALWSLAWAFDGMAIVLLYASREEERTEAERRIENLRDDRDHHRQLVRHYANRVDELRRELSNRETHELGEVV